MFFQHKCITNKGSSGSPIFNLKNKIIGIHKEYNYFNKGIFLNSPIKEFIKQNFNFQEQNDNKNQKKLLKEFKKNYKDIENTDIASLNMTASKNKLKEEGFNILCQIEFKEMKKLDVHDNKINHIIALKKAKFDKLEELNLRNNNISDISSLSQVNLKYLKILNLGDNHITDISVLEKVEFKDLEQLFLDENKILSDISILDKVNFEKLKILQLHDNEISNIDVFENSNFPALQNLNLSINQISNIDSLGKSKIKEVLKELYLNNNPDITDINSLQNFRNLDVLYVLMYNKKIDHTENKKTIEYFRNKKGMQFH